MYKQHRISVVAALGLLSAAAVSSFAAPTPALIADQTNCIYTIGQPVRWRLEGYAAPSGGSAALRYKIKQGGLTVLREGTVVLTNDTATIEATLPEPGSLRIEGTLPGPTGTVVHVSGGALVDPERISPSMSRPADFDAFWESKLSELAQVPANPKLEACDSGQENVSYWKITLDNIRDTQIHGQLARPKEGDKFPALLIVQWAGVYGLDKGWVTGRAKEGWLTLNISAHDLPIDQAKAFYQEQSDGPLKDYPAIGNDDRETSYFLRMYLSCYRAAQYLTERDDWDGRVLVVTGGSQGGLQTLMLAGLHPRVTAALAGVPAGCDMAGPDVGRAPGWPMWYWKTQNKDPDKVHRASQYYDVVNFASRIQCPVLVGMGLIDQTCPPAGVYAALNQITSPKEVILLPRGEHQDRNGAHAAYYARFGAWLSALRQGQSAPMAKPEK